LVLRRSESKLDKEVEMRRRVPIRKLVGECYVGGVMNGEAFDIELC
jgi:hypothetical protein